MTSTTDADPAGALGLRWKEKEGTPKDWVDVLARLPLFAGLSKRQLRKIAEQAQIEHFAPQEVIVQHGDPGDAFYVVLNGTARVLGRQRARGTLRAGDFFGEMALLDGGRRSATVMAAGELVALMLARRPFLRVLEQEPKIAIAILGELSARIRELDRRLVT